MKHQETDTALERLFEHERLTGSARWFSLPGGAHLYSAGEPSSELYLLKAGRLGAFRKEEGQERQFLGVIRPGEPAGEMALIAGAPHSGQVVALRDSEVLALSREDFFAAAEADPAVMTELARLMILRMRQASGAAATQGDPTVFGFIAADGGRKLRPLIDKIALAIARGGHSVTVVGAEATHAPTEWFSNTEADYDYVLYAAESAETNWKTLVGRQVDRLFIVGRGDRPLSPKLEIRADPLQEQQLVDLILIQTNDCRRPTGSAAWLDATGAARLFHLRDGQQSDIERIARVLTGRSVGLVLSGGGARAYAHIGAIHALRERNIPVDFVGGASMGAIVAAGVAMGWDDKEMDHRIRAAFVDTSPLDDIAFPLIAMTQGEKVKQRLEDHFGEVDIADLWLPFFCVSSNLTSGVYQLHRRGPLRSALRASISLPGVMPPVTDDGNVLVDGAVMKNFPTDIMRAIHLGPVVGVDVTRGRSLDADDVARPPSVWRWILSGEWRRGPPIVGLLMRTATVSTGREITASRQASDLLILPEVGGVDLRDWKAYDTTVAIGHKAAAAALDGLAVPVTELRRRKQRT